MILEMVEMRRPLCELVGVQSVHLLLWSFMSRRAISVYIALGK